MENLDKPVFSVSQEDWNGNCECDRCREIDAEEGSPAGTLLRFINRVAEAVEEDFPEVTIDINDMEDGQRGEKKSITYAQWQARGFDEHSVLADPLFVDPDNGDYALKADSPALALGFQPADLSRVGVREPGSRR